MYRLVSPSFCIPANTSSLLQFIIVIIRSQGEESFYCLATRRLLELNALTNDALIFIGDDDEAPVMVLLMDMSSEDDFLLILVFLTRLLKRRLEGVVGGVEVMGALVPFAATGAESDVIAEAVEVEALVLLVVVVAAVVVVVLSANA